MKAELPLSVFVHLSIFQFPISSTLENAVSLSHTLVFLLEKVTENNNLDLSINVLGYVMRYIQTINFKLIIQ